VILCAAAALPVAIAAHSVWANDTSMRGTSDETEVIFHLNEKIRLNPKSAFV
jgi:hypothetical protein